MKKYNHIQLIIPCEVRISGLEIQLECAIEREDYDGCLELKKQIDDLKAKPKDDVVECKPTTLHKTSEKL